jgi:hypothetical protein
MSVEQWWGQVQRNEWRPTRGMIALGTLALFVAIIIGALYLSQSAATSSVGRQLETLVTERNELERQNEQLRAEIASLRGVGRLLTRAQELGFEQAGADDIEYVVVPGYEAERVVISQAAEAAPPAPVYDESFTGWVQQQLDNLRQQFEGFVQEAG